MAQRIGGFGDNAETVPLNNGRWRLGGDGDFASQTVGGQIGDEQVGLRAADTGDQIVARSGRESVVALSDVVKIARGDVLEVIEVGQGLG